MARNGGRSGTFHGEMDRCRESQGWTTACSRMPERDGKDQRRIAQSKRARAGPLALDDQPQVVQTYTLRAFGLQISCRLSVVLRLFCFVLFSYFAFIKAAALCSIVLQYACAPIAPGVSSFFTFAYLGMSLFPNIVFCTFYRFSRCIESSSYVFSFRMV